MRWSRPILFVLLAAPSVAWLALGETADPVPTALATGVLTGLAILLIDQVPDFRWVWMALVTTFRCRNRLVRISVSYLFRIKVDARYLLIGSARWPGTYAPVGGVYKRLPGSEKRLERLKVLDDDCHPIDERSAADIRVRVPGRNVVRFLRWFEREEDRELSPWREFYEEMIQPGHLPAANFPYIHYRYLGRHWTYPRWSSERGRFEMFVADIYDLVPTPKQREDIASLQESEDLRWVSEQEIRSRGVVDNQQPVPNISERTIWTL
jgi:hypothetical protein